MRRQYNNAMPAYLRRVEHRHKVNITTPCRRTFVELNTATKSLGIIAPVRAAAVAFVTPPFLSDPDDSGNGPSVTPLLPINVILRVSRVHGASHHALASSPAVAMVVSNSYSTSGI
jgi:hypothetical protein